MKKYIFALLLTSAHHSFASDQFENQKIMIEENNTNNLGKYYVRSLSSPHDKQEISCEPLQKVFELSKGEVKGEKDIRHEIWPGIVVEQHMVDDGEFKHLTCIYKKNDVKKGDKHPLLLYIKGGPHSTMGMPDDGKIVEEKYRLLVEESICIGNKINLLGDIKDPQELEKLNQKNNIIFQQQDPLMNNFTLGSVPMFQYLVENGYVVATVQYPGSKLMDGLNLNKKYKEPLNKEGTNGQEVVDSMINAVFNQINYIKELNYIDEDNINVVGHSWGGWILWHLLQKTKGIKNAVFYNAAPPEHHLNLIHHYTFNSSGQWPKQETFTLENNLDSIDYNTHITYLIGTEDNIIRSETHKPFVELLQNKAIKIDQQFILGGTHAIHRPYMNMPTNIEEQNNILVKRTGAFEKMLGILSNLKN